MTAPSQLSVRLLGPVEVLDGYRTLKVGAAKQRAILAMLALNVASTVSVHELIDGVWGDRAPARPRKATQVLVSELRRAISDKTPEHATLIETREPGYVLGIPRGNVDLFRFDEHRQRARELLARSQPEPALAALDEALGSWRGAALADVRDEGALAIEAMRLDDVRLACLEEQIELSLALGRHAEMSPRLEQLAGQHPLREGLQRLRMLALYRCNRQADALTAYRDTTRLLRNELGISPSTPLTTLQRSILNHDPAIDLQPQAAPAVEAETDRAERGGSILVVTQRPADLDSVAALGAELAVGTPHRELIIAGVVEPSRGASSDALSALAERLAGHRSQLKHRDVKVAALLSSRPARDISKLAFHQDADLILLDGSEPLLQGGYGMSDELTWSVPAAVALLVGAERGPRPGPIVVPFGGGHNDWAALELAASLAAARNAAITVAGSAIGDQGDASRLVAVAGLVIQRQTGIMPRPVLVEPGAEGILSIAKGAGMLVLGLSRRFRSEGLGALRDTLARQAESPVVFVQAGPRQAELAAERPITHLGWSALPLASDAGDI
jgi:DNA-binding SARP family transcriptional activator